MARGALREGLEAGRNPRSVALELIGRIDAATGTRQGGLIGLTSQQAKYVANAGQELDALDRAYFNRILRDKRYDSLFSKAIRNGKPLTSADRGKITARYSDRMLKFRGDMIARTEAITAMRAASHEGFLQVVESGRVQDEQIERTWDATGDTRTRGDHMAMNGQVIYGMGAAFMSPDGSAMMYPGDTSLGAGPEQTINCRCVEATRIKFIR